VQKTCAYVTIFLLCVLSSRAFAEAVTFTLLRHSDNTGLLPQCKGIEGFSGDHLLRTADDLITATWNPNGCFSFNFMNSVGVSPPDYPAGYAGGIHSMEGTIGLDIDLSAGGSVTIGSLSLDGQAKYVSSGDKLAYQYLVKPGDTATNGNYGPVDGIGNSGSYDASAALNWAFTANIDWYYDTPCPGPGVIDMTFNDYRWDGFIIPVSELTASGMAAAALDDPLGFFAGKSENFEDWLLDEVGLLRLPAEAKYLLFAQGEAKPVWNNPEMAGWDSKNGILGETILAYAVPEPATTLLFAAGLCGLAMRRPGSRS